MNCPPSQLQHNFTRHGFWHGQFPSVSSSASVAPCASVAPSASAHCSVSVTSSDSALSSALLPAFYQPNVTASPQLNVPSVIGQANSSVSAPFASLVHPSPVVFSAPSTINSLNTSHSSAVRFPFPAGVGPIMNPFEMIGTDSQMFPQTVRLNSNLALCSNESFGGYVNANALPSAGTNPSVSGSGLHHFAIPRISHQSETQPAQGLQFSLGQPTFFGGHASPRDGRQQQTQNLFDLSNSVMCTNSSLTNANVISMAAAISKGSLLSQYQSQQTTKQSSECASQRKSYAFCHSSVPSPPKQTVDSTEPVNIPKETVTIPLERSCASSSSAGSVGEHRSQQSKQMSCQVCYLAASNGLHFGARTCAACAAFFRRSISDQKRYICKRSQRCVIRAIETQGYRKICRNCRMKRCLEVGMLPENVQNKRNKRDFYFADALSNAISQQQQRSTQQQKQSNSTGNGREAQSGETERAKDGDAKDPQGEQRRKTESHGTTEQFGSGDMQRQNNNEYGQQQTENGTLRARTVVENNDQTKPNSTAPWGITLREI